MSSQILVLDDEEDFLQALCELLRGNYFSVVPFLHPHDALEAVNKEEFDLIISDYRMPDMNGGEFLIELRNIRPKVPVIFLSAYMDVGNMVQVSQKGVVSIMEKPFDSASLIEEIEKYVSPVSEDSSFKDLSLPAVRKISIQECYDYVSDQLGDTKISTDLWGVLLIQPWKSFQELDICLTFLQTNPDVLPAKLLLHLDRSGVSLAFRQADGLGLVDALTRESSLLLEKLSEYKVHQETVDTITQEYLIDRKFDLSKLF